MDPGPVKILYIDDEKINLTNFKFLFQDDYEIFTAMSAREGLEILKLHEFQIVISDQRMPDITGTEFLSQVALLYPDSIRILLTAYTETADIIDAINIGHVYQYITKPYGEKAVKNVLQKASEIWFLKKSNQELLVQLKEKNEEYEQLNEELKQSNEELYQAKERAEESDRLKTSFLQNMSHEIRTPMNAIMGFSYLLKENLENREKLLMFSEIICGRCNDLLDIINEILDISIIESGLLPANLEECDVHELFGELLVFFNEYKKRVEKGHLSFGLEVSHELNTKILTDKVKLKQILINLITNALKFTDEGLISGGCDIVNNTIRFFVADTGIGIPIEKQEQIFERFIKLDYNQKGNIVGTGLGLSIVKSLVNILGGEISLISASGKGSTFSFSIPYMPVKNGKSTENQPNQPFAGKLMHKRVLVVEDDIYNAAYIREVLIKAGLEVTIAKTGKEAIDTAFTQNFDIILMDINLPDINGYEVTRTLLDKFPYLKIMAQTAYASNDDKLNALQNGCLDYISKPIKKELLLEKIENLLLPE